MSDVKHRNQENNESTTRPSTKTKKTMKTLGQAPKPRTQWKH